MIDIFSDIQLTSNTFAREIIDHVNCSFHGCDLKLYNAGKEDGDGEIPGMLKSRDRSRSRDVSRPDFDGLGLGLEACSLGL